MTVPVPHPRHPPARRPIRSGLGARFYRCVPAGVLVVLLVAAGCRSKDGSGGGSSRASDPLVVGPGRIPKQNIPIPDRGGTAGGKTRDDPLLGSPTGRPGDRTGAGYTDDPERWKGGPYKPGLGGTPAALAGRPKDDGEGLKIDALPGGVPLTPVGGVMPGGPDPAGISDPLLGQLARYGVKRGDYSVSHDNGQVVIRVKVPISSDGPVRSYAGVGPTEAEAVKQVVDQIKAGGK
ncbi:MAG: hypothetical protein JWO38_3705 [Gemmataceae bacterium]|nr:hypothetical protein [Gemmataceae bacterium]